MKLATVAIRNTLQAAVIDEQRGVLPIGIPTKASTLLELIEGGASAMDALRDRIDRSGAADWLRLTDVALQAPIPRPRKNVFCVGRNYRAHIVEAAEAKGIEVSLPKVPELFSKPVSAVIGPDTAVNSYPHLTTKLDYEVELAVVIGKRVRDLTPSSAMDAVFGYTIVNDISARDVQFAHGQWFKGKAFDTFCPMGPWIVTKDEFGLPSGHRIYLSVNGKIRQDSNTADLLFGIPEILAALSAGMTLEPGDIIATGTPSGVALGMPVPAYLKAGDRIVAGIEGIGELRNPVV